MTRRLPERETVPPRTREALRAAHLYYLQDLTMDAIARELGTSRSSVSRLLSHARDSGLVEITIHSPLDSPSRIERDILDGHGVAAHVVPVPDHVSDVDRLERVALSAARILGRFVDSNQAVGVAWGYASVPELIEAGADHILREPAELLQWLEISDA